MSNLPHKESIKRKEPVIARYMENKQKYYNLASSKENMEMLSQKQRDELSLVLFDLKNEHDLMALESSNKANEAELLKKKISILELNAKKMSNSFKEKTAIFSTMKALIKEKKLQQSEEKQCNHLFRNKIDKLAKDIFIIHQDINAIENQTRKTEAQIELGKFNCHNIKTKVNTIHMKVANQKEINEKRLDEQEQQKGYYQQIIQQKNTFIQSADERKIRQNIAAEKAKNNTDDLNEIIIRRKLHLLKIYNHYLAIKMNDQLQDNSEIEDAYIQIRDLCGTSKISDIVDFILTKDKNYNLKNELILQNENTQQKLKDYLKTLEHNYQEMLTQVIINDDLNTKSESVQVVNVIEEEDKEILAKESELVERLDTLLEIQKNVSLVYDKTIGNINHLCHMVKFGESKISDNKGNTNPIKFTSGNNTVTYNNKDFDTSNYTSMVNIESNQLKQKNIEPNNEELIYNDYISFLKNSYDTFYRLFLCNSKQDFLKIMKAKGASQQEQLAKHYSSKSMLKLPLTINTYNNKSTLRKKSKHYLQSFSSTDIFRKTNQGDDEEDNIAQKEQQTQKEIMRHFLHDIKKERDNYILSLVPLPEASNK